jgi:predicted RNase H-like HicB family nuclease
MRFEGTLVRDGRFWLAEIPLLDAITQGRTRAEALKMIADWLETMVNRPDFIAEIYPRGKSEFELAGNDVAAMTALLLRRRREASGASLRDVASRLGASSRNAYARYERGEVVPTVDKLDALLKAAAPDADFVIRESSR